MSDIYGQAGQSSKGQQNAASKSRDRSAPVRTGNMQDSKIDMLQNMVIATGVCLLLTKINFFSGVGGFAAAWSGYEPMLGWFQSLGIFAPFGILTAMWLLLFFAKRDS